jgi:hypothetical protein
MYLVGIEDPFSVNWDAVIVGWTCSAGNQDSRSAEHLGPVVTRHFDGMGIEESRGPLDHGDAVAAKLRFYHFDLAGHDCLCPEDQILHRDLIFDGVAPAVEGSKPEPAQVQDRFPERFAGNRAGVDTHTAHCAAPLDDGDAPVQFRRANRRLLSGRAASYNDQVVLLSVHVAA